MKLIQQFLGQGKCGVALIRISGPQCNEAMKIISGLKESPPPRTAVLRKLRHPESGKIIDRGLVLYFPSCMNFDIKINLINEKNINSRAEKFHW